MNWFSRIKESPNYEKLKNSLEFRAVRRQGLVMWILTAVLLLLISLADVGKSARAATAFVVTVLVFVPISLYYVYRVVSLFFKIERWTFSEVVLDRPHMGGRGSASFTVTLRDRSGRELQRDTGSIFTNTFEPFFDDCINKKALVGYNDETDTVAVIQILP